MAAQYSKAHIRYVVSCRRKGWKWDDIAINFNEIFKEKRTGTQLRDACRKSSWMPGSFENTREGIGDIIKTNITDSTIFLTAAYPLNPNLSATSNAHKGFFKAIETFVKHRKAKPMIGLMRGHVKALQNQPSVFDETLQKYRSWWVTHAQLGRYIKVIDTQINPQNINPMSGIKTLGTDNGFLFKDEDHSGDLGAELRARRRSSIIIPNPKQMLETIPTGFGSSPRLIMSTGACVDPQYLHNSIGIKAADTHTLGGLVIEIKGSKFFPRQVQADPETGEFVDLGHRYHPGGTVTEERAEFLDPGDAHLGTHNDVSFDSLMEMMQFFQPMKVFWNDFWSGISVNPYGRKKGFTAANLPPHLRSILAEAIEVRRLKAIIESQTDAEQFVVWSNHHKWLFNYIDAGSYVTSGANRNLCVQLECLMQLGYDPFHVLMEGDLNNLLGIATDGLDSKWKYFQPGEDYFVEGVHMNNHGHAGINKPRGSIMDAVVAFGKSNRHHTHMPFIYNHTYGTGTIEEIQDFNADQPRSWLPGHIVGYTGGMRQLIIEVDGDWKA